MRRSVGRWVLAGFAAMTAALAAAGPVAYRGNESYEQTDKVQLAIHSGDSSLLAGDYDEARADSAKALADYLYDEKKIAPGPGKARIYSTVAILYQDKGDAKNADKYLRMAQDMDPGSKAAVAKPASKSAAPSFRFNFVDRNGRLISDNGFDEIMWFKNGLAAVKVGGAWGYIGKSGATVVPPAFESVNPEFPPEGPALVKKAGKFGYIDRTGTFVIEPQFDSAYDFSEGLAAVKSGTRWGYIDLKGQIAFYVDGYSGTDAATGSELKQTIIDLWPFKEGVALAKIKLAVRSAKTGQENNFRGWSYVTRDGLFHMLAYASYFHRGMAVVRRLDDLTGTTYHIVRNSELLARGAPISGKTVQLKEANQYSHAGGYFVVKHPKDRLENLMDWNGDFVSKEWFVGVSLFSEGLAGVTRRLPSFEHERGYIDQAGNPVVPLRKEIEAQSDFREGFAANKTRGKWGYIDRTGRWAIEPRFDYAASFSEGMAAVRLGGEKDGEGRWFLIDKSGQEVGAFPQGHKPTMTRYGYAFSEGWMPVIRRTG